MKIEKFYYMSAEKMAADGFVNGYRTRWTAGFGEIVEAAEVVPAIGDLPRDGWSLSEEFSDKQDRYVVTGLKTPDMFIGLGGTVFARREYKVADLENNDGRMFYVPRRALTAEESAFAAETMTRLLAEKDAAAKRQADMVAAINAGEDPADAWE